jgi:glycosyltransferase involved in cell wall biosynthesis
LSTGARAGALRVMIVTDQYAPMVGGVPTVTRELADGLAERGHAVAVLAPSPDRAGRGLGVTQLSAAAAGAAGEGAVHTGLPGSVGWPWYAGQRLGLLPPSRAGALISGFAADVVHIHSPLTLGAAARAAARRQRVPVLYTNHYLPLNVRPRAAARPSRHNRSAAAFDAAFYGYVTGFANGCDHVTAPTMTALRLLRAHGLRVPSQAVSNGVDLRAFRPPAGAGDGAGDDRAGDDRAGDDRAGDDGSGGGSTEAELRVRYGLPPGRPVVLSVGRLSPEKRADVLLGALARSRAWRADGAGAGGTAPVLVLAGAGPDGARLRSLARHYGVAERVVFPGFVPDADLPALYRLADVFAIASQAELQSLVTMAALASGLPVVAVDAGALAELVHQGENGFLARPGHAEEIAGSLDLLCADAGLRARMGKASLRIIGEHDRHSLLARWESIYRMLGSNGSAQVKNRRR